MPAIQIILVDGGLPDSQLRLEGTSDGTNFIVTKFVVPNPSGGPSEIDLAPTITGSLALLKDIDAGQFVFDPAASGPHELKGAWQFSTSKPVFGRVFDASTTVNGMVTVVIPGGGGQIVVRVRVCGRVQFGTTGASFTSAPFCFEFEFPLGKPPRLSLELPRFGFDIPAIELPWSFPDLLPFPDNWPAMSFDLPPLGGRASFRAIAIRHESGKTTLVVHGLVLEGRQQSVEADAALVFEDGKLKPSESTVKFLRPNLPSFNLPQWEFDEHDAERCLMLAETGTPLNTRIGHSLKRMVIDCCETSNRFARRNASCFLTALTFPNPTDRTSCGYVPPASATICAPGINTAAANRLAFRSISCQR